MKHYNNIVDVIRMPKDRVRKCLVCQQEFKTDRSTYVCNKCKNEESRDEMRVNSRAGQLIRERN